MAKKPREGIKVLPGGKRYLTKEVKVKSIKHQVKFIKQYLKPHLKHHWFSILLLILFSIFTIVNYKHMKKEIQNIKQENLINLKNLKGQVEYSLDWGRMLCDKQAIIISQLYDRRIISKETQEALQWRNELWLRQQMQRKRLKGGLR